MTDPRVALIHAHLEEHVRREMYFSVLRIAAELREALRWALNEIDSEPLAPDDPDFYVPPHTCEFTTNPLKGACDFHDGWVRAAHALALAGVRAPHEEIR